MRCTLEDSRIFCSPTDDLAVIAVPQQVEDAGKEHFYLLNENDVTPSCNEIIEYIGYPSAQAQPLGENYAVTPNYSFGEICEPNCDYDFSREFTSLETNSNRAGSAAQVLGSPARQGQCGRPKFVSLVFSLTTIGKAKS